MGRETILLALGGNAILRNGQDAGYESQLASVMASSRQVARLVKQGYRVVITHGNGPQVGNLLRQNEEASAVVPPMPMDVLSSETQGFIGYMMQQCLSNALLEADCPQPVISLVSRVEVDPNDPAFAEPAKPVGMFYDEATAKSFEKEKGWVVKPDSGRGWRRVVPSPTPLEIVEKESILHCIEHGIITISCGGGGIPVVKSEKGHVGVEAVIDKDLSGACLAEAVGADIFLIVTDVPHVFINYGSPEQAELTEVELPLMEEYQEQGQFAGGSMGPKVKAALRFVRATGKPALICALDQLEQALAGKSGTRIWN